MGLNLLSDVFQFNSRNGNKQQGILPSMVQQLNFLIGNTRIKKSEYKTLYGELYNELVNNLKVYSRNNKQEYIKMQIMAKEIKDILEAEDFKSKLDEVQRLRRIMQFVSLDNDKKGQKLSDSEIFKPGDTVGPPDQSQTGTEQSCSNRSHNVIVIFVQFQ
jgi:hypothetical protein